MGKEDLRAAWEAKVFKNRQEQYALLAERANQLKLRREVYTQDRKKMLLLNLTDLSLTAEQVARYLSVQSDYNHLGRGGYCKMIASRVASENQARGIISTHFGAFDLTGWVDHWINFDLLEDDSAIALDFSTAATLDWNNDKLHLLGIKTPDMTSLLPTLNGIYGGDWYVMPESQQLARFPAFSN